MAPPPVPWELVVVDNGSTDNTGEVVESFRGRLPVRPEREHRAGLSHARNAGVLSARGDYIVWTDDDVLVDPNWLTAYAAAFRRWPEAAVFGGRALAYLEPPTPAWVAENVRLLDDMFGVRDFGDKPLPISSVGRVIPFGLNYAVRAAEQRSFPYDPNLGVAPGRRRGGEETTVIRAIIAAGGSGVWIPDATVTHVVPTSRQTEAYVLQFYRSGGEHFGAHMDPGDNRSFFGAPRWRWAQLVRSFILYKLARRSKPASVWLPYLQDYAYQGGWIAGSWSRPR
jgi:glycosyltransferase involved in cell wall biosynthesis